MKAILGLIIAAIGVYIGVGLIPNFNTGTLNSNVHRITCQIRGKLNSEMSKLITELSREAHNLSGDVERLDGRYP